MIVNNDEDEESLQISSTRKVDCQISPVSLFWLNTLEGMAKAPDPAVDILRLNILRNIKTAFFS